MDDVWSAGAFTAADELARVCREAASTLEGQSGLRASWRSAGAEDFQGHFADLFRDNGVGLANDVTSVAQALRDVATNLETLSGDAEAENTRRRQAREWEEQHDDWYEKVADWWNGVEKPTSDPIEPTTYSVSKPSLQERQPLQPGAGGGSSAGTSSANPDYLRTFARNMRSGDGELRDTHQLPAVLRRKDDAFVAANSQAWGGVEATGVWASIDDYLAANEQDAGWADAVAGAFEAAGGSGAVSTLPDAAVGAALAAAGIPASREPLAVDPPRGYGGQRTTGYADDPVNVATGNFIEEELDLAFAGGCGGLRFARMYNSFDERVGAFGPGWSSWAETRLELTDESARWIRPDGRAVVFPRLGEGWDRSIGDSFWIEATPKGEKTSVAYLITDNAGGRWWFTASGRLTASDRGEGTRIDALYDAQGRLAGLVHERARSLSVTWDDARCRIVAVEASDGRRAAYDYDDAGRLTRARLPQGDREYRWDDAGLLAAVVDADGVVEVENTFDDERRVARQRSRFGRVTVYSYLPGQVTVVADEDGSRANTWISDDRGRLTGVVDADGHRQSMAYDRWGNKAIVTERDGARTVALYDDRGRQVRWVGPSGADVQTEWDGEDRVTLVVAGEGVVTAFEYEGGERNPSQVTDPEGGVTALEWSDGLLTAATGPGGAAVRFAYDGHGDLVAVTDPAGNTARLERDGQGRVVAAVTPLGFRTSFIYDEHGFLVERREPDGGVWRFGHTAAGRLSQVTDPLGAVTSVERGDHGEEIASIDPLGRVMRRVVDDVGLVAESQLPDGSVWRFAYDALSRLTVTTDPAGGVWRQEYDEVGDLVASTDPTGVRRSLRTHRAKGTITAGDGVSSGEAQVDSFGRLTKMSVGEDAEIVTYDRCGRPVELLDADGGLTVIRRDLAGRVVELVTPAELATRFVYDVCGRLSETTDPAGGVTRREYDADGRLIRQINPEGEATIAEYDPVGRLTRVTRPGWGTACYVYDMAGRLTRSQDPWYGTRRYSYDAAGQVVSITNGVGGVTRYDYDECGRVVAITDPLGGVVKREWDVFNHLVAETDPLGRVTRGVYDAAGRQVEQTDPTGRVTEWAFDRSGRVGSVSVDGSLVSRIDRDLPARRVTITDRTGEQECSHVLEWDRLGRLIRKTRSDQSLSWDYDRDGRRTGMTTPDGTRSEYRYDGAGRLAMVDHPILGRAVFTYDGAGRVVAADAGGTNQTWAYDDGFVTRHTVVDASGVSETVIGRDGEGRVAVVSHGGESTSYRYDEAGQLVAADSSAGRRSWSYDLAGRMIEEHGPDGSWNYTYDSAGQLLRGLNSEGTAVEHSYDAAGRRVSTSFGGGSARDYQWSATGWLSGITQRGEGGVRHTDLHVDATGELASIDGVPLWWDDSSLSGASLAQAGGQPVLALGAVTGIGDRWETPGWRSRRPTVSQNPWAQPMAFDAGDTPGAFSLSPSGGVAIAGLEWLGARPYDPASHGFLSVDPLDPVAGAGWASNPYSYAGNNPVGMSDPAGLSPMTDVDLQAYADAHGSHWEYVAGAAAVVAGGVLVAVGGPVGAAIGGGLISAGVDTIMQKATTGEVDWGKVAVNGAIGMIGGGVAGVATKNIAGPLVRTVANGAIDGGIGGGASYLTGPGPHTVTGFLGSTLAGAAMGGAGGAAGHGLTTLGGKALSHIKPKVEIPQPHLPQQTLADLEWADRITRRITEDGGPFHDFPKLIDSMVSVGEGVSRTDATGQIVRDYLIPGTINGHDGVFEWVVDESGTIIHRGLFIMRVCKSGVI
jgi:RHS repeat-associated protein